MDTLDRSIADFVKWWPRWLREEMASVGAERVRDVLRLHPLDIVCAPKGSQGGDVIDNYPGGAALDNHVGSENVLRFRRRGSF